VLHSYNLCRIMTVFFCRFSSLLHVTCVVVAVYLQNIWLFFTYSVSCLVTFDSKVLHGMGNFVPLFLKYDWLYKRGFTIQLLFSSSDNRTSSWYLPILAAIKKTLRTIKKKAAFPSACRHTKLTSWNRKLCVQRHNWAYYARLKSATKYESPSPGPWRTAVLLR
jgi:hypothetical protein